MKAYLLYRDQDFDWDAELPPNHEDLVRDLELDTLLQAMATGDKRILEVSEKVLLAGLDDPDTVRYRQDVLTDGLAQPAVVRQLYAVATEALEDKRRRWGMYGGTYQSASSNLSGAVSYLEAYVAQLRVLRQIADDHAAQFHSEGMRRLFATLQRDLDDTYFDKVRLGEEGQLQQSRRVGGLH